jgi:hypothetical protein
MTTIAANMKMMVSDSMVSDDSCDIKVDKITVVGGAIVGCTGTMTEASKFLEYIEGMGNVKRPKLTDFEALVLTEEGLFWYDKTCRARPITEGFAAVGTGTQAAMAALREGRGPLAAVRHAALADKNTAPPFRQITLAALKRRKG